MATRTFSIRLTPDQLVALKAAAGGRGASGFARDAVVAAVEGRRMTRRQRERDHLHRSLAHVQAALMELVDRFGLGRHFPPEPVHDRAPTAAEVAALREAVQLLVSSVLQLGRRIEDGA